MTTSRSRPAALRRILIAAGFLAASIISCERTPTGPSNFGATRPARAFSIAPTFPPAFQTTGAGELVSFTHVRILLRHPDGSVALDTVIVFPPDVDEVPLELHVPMLASAPPTGESMALSMKYVNAAGDTVFSGGPVTLTVLPAVVGAPPAPPVNVPVTYTGVGATATKVVISPKTQTVFGGDALSFTAQAFDANGVVVPGTPIFFSTSDATVVDVSPGGSAIAQSKRGSATITAQLLTGPTDAASVNVILHATVLSAVSGNGQSAPMNATLSQPVVVRVTAPDGVGVAGVPVAFAAGNGGSAGSSSVVSDVNGFAQSSWQLGPALGAQTLTASATGLSGSPLTFGATATSGPAARLVITGQPGSAVANASIGTVVVAAQDALGNAATNFAGTVSLSLSGGTAGAALSGVTSATAVAGVATFTNLSVNRSGTGYTLSAGASGLTGATSSSFDIAAGPAALLSLVSGGGQSALAGSVLAPVVVVVTDAATNPIPNFTVSFAVVTGGGAVGPVSATTNALGQASTTWTLGPTVGAQSITAAASGLTTLSVGATATAPPPPPTNPATQLSITTQPTNATAGAVIAPAVVVTARDAAGAPATSFTGNVTLVIGTNPGAGTLSGTVTVAAVAGVATFNTLSINKSGAGYTLVANSGTLVPATTTPFNIAAAAAASLAFSVQPATSGTGVPIAPPVQVSALDAFGNVATSFTGIVTVAIGTNAGGGSLTGTTAVAAVAGVATFSTLAITASGAGYTLTANSGALTGAVSTPFTIAASVLTWTNPAGGNWSTPSNWSLGRVPLPTDSIVIALAGTYGISLDTTFTGAFIALGAASGTQTLTLNSRTLTVSGGMTIGANGALTLAVGTITGAGTVTNSGLILVNGNCAINNPLVTTAGSTLRMAGSGFGSGILTVANGFTNNGTIDLTSTGSGFPAQLSVTAGTLTNAAAGTINSLPGVGGGRTLTAQLANLGTITITSDLLINAVNAAHTNSGAINLVIGNLTVQQSGGAPSFTSTGSVSLAGAQTWAVNSGTLNLNAATIGTGTLALSAVTLNLGVPFSTGTSSLTLASTTVNGPGSLTNAGGQNLTMNTSTINASAPFINQGLLIVHGASAINSAVTTAVGSTLRMEGSGLGSGILTIATGFTNNGTIELTSAGSGFPGQLTVTTGTLTNAAGAAINSLPGVGGARTLTAALANLGTVTITADLLINAVSAAHTNSGTITMTGANLTLTQTGGAPSFTNTGTMTLGAGQTWSVSGGDLNLNAAIGGTGTLALSAVSLNLGVPFTNATTSLSLLNSAVNGPGSLTNAVGQSLTMGTSAISASAAFINQGLLVVHGASTVSSTLTTVVGSTLRMEGSGAGSGILTVANGFTNNGTIELTSAGSGFPAQLTVTTGTLTNAAGAAINSLPGVGGARTLTAALANLGTVTVTADLLINATNAVHTNSGAITLTGASLTLNQSGGAATFTNAGTVTLGAGQSWSVNSGALNLNAAIGGTGTLALSAVTLNLGVPFTNATTSLSMLNSTVNGPGSLTNATGQTLTIGTSTINASAAFINQGLFVVHGSSAVNSAVTAAAGSTLRMEGTGAGSGILTVANGFTSNGTIELTSAGSGFPAQLTVTTGTLTNAAGAAINSLPGVGGTRTLTAELANLGTVTVTADLLINAVNAAHTNSGTITMTGANLTLTQSGGAPSFTNTGSVSTGAGQTWTVTSGALNLNAAIGGAGTLALNAVTLNLGVPFTNATTALSLLNSTVNGPGALTNAPGQTLTIGTSTISASAALINQGLFVVHGASAVNSAVTTAVGSTLRMEGTGAGTGILTVANGFTNNGTIELTSAGSGFPAQLTVTTGTLTNAAGAAINVLTGVGGTRTLTAALANLGTVTLSTALTINATSATHTNSGVIDISGGSLTLTQSGVTPSFTNTGTITIASGQSWTVTGGTLSNANTPTAGTIRGAGTLDVSTSTFTNAGVVNPGTSPGILTITGPYTQSPVGSMNLELNGTTVGTQYDRLVVSGAATLNGTLNVLPGYTMVAGDSLVVMTFASRTGNFASINGLGPSGSITIDTVWVPAAGAATSLSIVAHPTSGSVKTWVNAAGGNWSTAANWSGGTLPTSLDTVSITGASTFTVTLDVNAAARQINIGGGAGTQTFTVPVARTLTLTTASSTVGANGQAMILGTVTGGTVTNTGTTTLNGGTVNSGFANQGSLFVSGTSAISGAFSNAAASLVRIGQIDGSVSMATLTVANGFTNNGNIQLTTAIAVAYSSQLVVTTGTLTNAVGAAISAQPGLAGGGSRTIGAKLDNQGTVTATTQLILSQPSAAHTNSGTMDFSAGDFALLQSGTTPSFTNSGTITIGASQAVIVTGGTFTQQAAATLNGGGTLGLSSVSATIGSAFALSALSLTASTVAFTPNQSNATTTYAFSSSTINGPGTFTNATGQSLLLNGTTFNTALINQGTLIVSGNSALNGALTTTVGSSMEIGQVDGSTSVASFTVANGFTNNGTIDLTVLFPVAYASQLVVSSGTLTNAAGSFINSQPGAAAGGTRTIVAQLDNQGTITATTPLTLNKANAAHTNSGTIDASASDFFINQGGVTPSFTNTGTITVNPGRTLTVNAGTFTNQLGATLNGGGIFSATAAATAVFNGPFTLGTVSLVASTGTFATAQSTATVAFILTNATVNGAGAFTNATGQTLTLYNSSISNAFTNQGTLSVSGNSQLSGALTTAAGSMIRIGQLDGATSLANLTVASGFTNNGAIELTTQVAIAYSAQLQVTAGTLVNAVGGSITALGGLAPGGTRTINAALDNQGSVTLYPGVAGSLALTGTTATGTGSWNFELGGLTAGTQHDQLTTSSAFNPAGTLNVTLINGFVPVVGNSFTLITRGTGAGGFTVNLPVLGGGLTWLTTYNAGSIVITVQ